MCTVKKQGNIYILTLTGNDEHRLNPTLITSIRNSLTQIESQFTQSNNPPSALLTTARGKFFSNGYDLAWANSTPNPTHSKITMDTQLQSLIQELISFPMPTIAAVTGHASAAGMILVMAHDYVVMRKERGFLYMSEMDIGLVVPEWFMRVLGVKIGGWRGKRRVVLKAEKVAAEAGVEIGVVDEVVEGSNGVVEKGVRVGEELVKRGWDGGVYCEIRKMLFKDVLDLIGNGGDCTSGNGEVGVRGGDGGDRDSRGCG